MNDTFRFLCRHHVWASKALLERCRTLGPEQLAAPAVAAYGSIIETLRHLVMSDAGYLRALGGPEAPWLGDGATEDGDLDELGRRLDETAQRWDAHLAAEDLDPDRVCVLDEGTYECPAGIVMAQVLHHGSLHREQVCAMLTALGVEPPDLQPWAFADENGISTFLGGRTG